MKNKTIKVDYLARVEGEGSIYIKTKGDQVSEVRLGIFEPPRFFEAFMRGRKFTEAPDITARICGICPIAYQTSSVNAMEDACRAKVPEPIRELRRLIYCGEWIESHALHIYLLHAPDFLGFEDAILMAKKFPKEVAMALRLKKLGNDIMIAIGGREIHPVNVRVGGFYKAPPQADLRKLVDELKWAIDASLKTVKLVATLDFPDLEQDYEYVALRHPKRYAIEEGRIVSNRGLDIPVQEYEKHFQEEHVGYANALHSVHKGKGAYFVGPLARYNLNFEQLSKTAKQAAAGVKLPRKCNNPFKGIIVRAVELVYACEESLRIIQAYQEPEKSFIEVKPRAGVGCGASEAPRGMLYHRYKIDAAGIIQNAKITPPTAQNQKQIEADLKKFVEKNIKLPEDQLTWKCEQAVRNYDPCISCATHFLKLKIERE